MEALLITVVAVAALAAASFMRLSPPLERFLIALSGTIAGYVVITIV